MFRMYIIIAFFLSTVAHANEQLALRTWTSKRGDTANGAFYSFNKKTRTVTLLMLREMPIDQLTVEDQKLIQRLAEASEQSAVVPPSDKAAAKPIANDIKEDTVTTTLKYSDNLRKWQVDYYRPCHVDLSSILPSKDWIQPKERGRERLYGQLTFGDTTPVKVVLDVLDNTDAVMVFAYGADNRFDNKMDYSRRYDENVKFRIQYSDGKEQPYTINAYYSVDFAKRIGKYRLQYHRSCLREGTLVVNGKHIAIAILDRDSDGFYSDLDDTSVLVDLNADGVIADIERFTALSPIKIADTFYVISQISPPGDRLELSRAQLGLITGIVTAEETGQPVSGANAILYPHKLSAMTDANGMFEIEAPEGRHVQLSVSADGLVPLHHRLRKNVVGGQTTHVPSVLQQPSQTLRGKLRLNPSDSYHFLAGKHYRLGGGDFYVGCSKGEYSFWANNRYQRGVIDLGNVANRRFNGIKPPKEGYSRFSVAARKGNTYVSLAKAGEEGHYVIFRVLEFVPDEYIEIQYYYR